MPVSGFSPTFVSRNQILTNMSKQNNFKVLAILRASTVRQEIESQKAELTTFLIGKGFKENEIDYIEAQGASARKANQQYLDFLAEIKHRIETNPNIRTVGLWHLNRLGRIKMYLSQMENYFVTNGIQMWVKNGFDMPLLGADGKETIGASIAFSVYSAMVENETAELFEKTRRGKERNKAEGKYNGGKIKLGYALNADKRFDIVPDKADVIRQIFDLFVNEDWSTNKIYHHFADLGIFKPATRIQCGSKAIIRILKDPAYIGEGLYPTIVSAEMQQKALDKIALFPKRHTPSNIYFCKSILKDTKTGTTFTARRATIVYQIRYVGHIVCLNINALDYITWFEAFNLFQTSQNKQRKVNVKEYAKRIEENEVKIENKRAQIDELREQIDRAIAMNIERPKHFPTERMNAVVDRCDREIDQIEVEIAQINTDNARMKQYLNNESKLTKAVSNLTDDYTDQMKKEIIDSVIERIEVTKVEQGKYLIQFINKVGIIDNSVYEYRFEGHKIYVVKILENGQRLDFSEAVRDPKNKRFQRERYANK